MWSQLIFFGAVALLIILLLRRSALSRKYIGAVGAYSQVGAAGLVSSVMWVAGRVKRLLSRIIRPRSTGTFGPAEVRGHQFWEDAAAPEKLELNTAYEEGERLYQSGQHDKAERFFLKAAANNPGDAKIYARLGLLYLQQKNYSDAIESLKVAVKLDKYNPSRHYNLALAYTGNKDTARAIAAVREAITLDPITQKYRQLLEQLLNS